MSKQWYPPGQFRQGYGTTKPQARREKHAQAHKARQLLRMDDENSFMEAKKVIGTTEMVKTQTYGQVQDKTI